MHRYPAVHRTTPRLSVHFSRCRHCLDFSHIRQLFIIFIFGGLSTTRVGYCHSLASLVFLLPAKFLLCFLQQRIVQPIVSELITKETFTITLNIASTTAGRSMQLVMFLLLLYVLFLLAFSSKFLSLRRYQG